MTIPASPRSASEHVFTDSSIIVREDEPTSIIAFTLASKTYRDRLRSVGHLRRDARRTDVTTEASNNVSTDDGASVYSFGNTYDDAQDTDDAGKREGGTHINYGEWRGFIRLGVLLSRQMTLPRPRYQISRPAALPFHVASFTPSDLPPFARAAGVKIDSLTRSLGASSLTALVANRDLHF